MKSRVHIMGPPGSGTTTLGECLAAITGLAHFDTDQYRWLPTTPPRQAKRKVSERLRMMHAALESKVDWVLSGSLDGWGDPLIPLFHLVVYLDVPTSIRLARLRQREEIRYGSEVLQPGGDRYLEHERFLASAAAYDQDVILGRNRRRHQEWLRRLPCPVISMDGDQPVDCLAHQLISRARNLSIDPPDPGSSNPSERQPI